MGYYGGFLYGTTLYGMATSISSVLTDSGPSTGGNDFIISGEGFWAYSWNDDFTGLVLDAAKWTDVSAGTGSITVGANHLTLASGAVAGGLGGVQSVATWTDAQIEGRFVFNPITTYATGTVYSGVITLYVDANNHASIGLTYSTSSSTLNLFTEVTKGGVLIDMSATSWTTGLNTLKLLRWGSRVFFYANGALIRIFDSFVSTAAYAGLYCTNGAQNFNAGSSVEAFYFRPFAVFDNYPVHDTVVVADNRIRGIVPPSVDNVGQSAAYAGLVDVSVVANGTDTSTDAYTYYYEDVLKILDSEQQDVAAQIINDSTTRTPTGVKKGVV